MAIDGKTVLDYAKESIEDITRPIKHRLTKGSPPLILPIWIVPYAGYFTPFYFAKQDRIKRRREILGLEFEEYTPQFKKEKLD